MVVLPMDGHAEFVVDLGAVLTPGPPIRELWLSSAYTSVPGVKALQQILTTSQMNHAILCCNAQTEWQALDLLDQSGVAVQVMPDPPGGTLHPNCLYAETEDGQSWAVIGSGNVTRGGFPESIEAGHLAIGRPWDKGMKGAKNFFHDIAEVAAPLTPALLSGFRAAQEEARAMRDVAAGSFTATLGFDATAALPLTPAEKRFRLDLDVQRFRHYVQVTDMQASYKMVILYFLLGTDTGYLPMRDLARMFYAFYRLVALKKGSAPERSAIGMAEAAWRMEIPRVFMILKGAPMDQLKRSGFLEITPYMVALGRKLWAGLTHELRNRGQQEAVLRLVEYYRQHLGCRFDFGQLLYQAERTTEWL